MIFITSEHDGTPPSGDPLRHRPKRRLNLNQEQQGLLNYDEILALWYFALAIWYGYLAFQNWKRRISQRQYQYRQLHQEISAPSVSPDSRRTFYKIHWFIFSISIMGLANFLFSFSLLEVLDHRSGIGGTVKKLSYANMVLACLRHPCTLSLGVLAPTVALLDSEVVPWLGPGGIRLPSGTKRTAMCLAALSCAQVVVRLTENLLVLFRYGKRDAPSLRLADFFEFVLDGVFLFWMMLNLYTATRQISRDYGGRLAWWRSHKLVYFWALYSIFVVIAAVQSLVGIMHYVINAATLSTHYMYTFFKINGINDLALLTGIAILLRPTQQGLSNSGFYGVSDGEHLHVSGSEITDDTTDYTLLLPNGSEGSIDQQEGIISFEMTAQPAESLPDPLMHPR